MNRQLSELSELSASELNEAIDDTNFPQAHALSRGRNNSVCSISSASAMSLDNSTNHNHHNNYNNHTTIPSSVSKLFDINDIQDDDDVNEILESTTDSDVNLITSEQNKDEKSIIDDNIQLDELSPSSTIGGGGGGGGTTASTPTTDLNHKSYGGFMKREHPTTLLKMNGIVSTTNSNFNSPQTPNLARRTSTTPGIFN